MNSAEINFLPHDKRVRISTGTLLLDAAQQAAIDVEAPCNGKGTCGKCRVQIMEGEAAEPHLDELIHLNAAEIAVGVRLACRSTVTGKSVVRFLFGARQPHL